MNNIRPLNVNQVIEILDVDGETTKVRVLSIDYLDRTATVVALPEMREDGPFEVPFSAFEVA